MSRKNSKEAKAKRRLENAWKETRYIPIPKPEEYISHIGFIPNDPFFHNSCLAATQSGCEEFAFRTKNQLIDFVENIDFPWKRRVNNKAGIPFIEVSCYFYHEPNCLSYDREILKSCDKVGWNENNYANSKLETGERGVIDIKKAKSGNVKALYLVRHRLIDGEWIKDKEHFHRRNPHFAQLNTIWVPLEEVKNLPEGLFTDDDKVYFSKFSETLQPMDEEELDRLFTAGKESILRNSYETNEEGEIIIEEYFNDEGKSIGFQPKKTRESWLRCFDPFPLSHKGNELLIGAAPETMNLFTGETNEYS